MKKQPNWGAVGALGTGVLIFVALLLIVFVVNPKSSQNAKENLRQEAAISEQQMILHAVICAQAQSTANAYRFRSLTPSGKVEPVRHFLTRMQAQEQTLRLSRGLGCKSSPGFPPFGRQIKRALEQIHRILSRYTPAEKEPIVGAFAPTWAGEAQPPSGAIGEEGVPAPPSILPADGHVHPPHIGKQPMPEPTPEEPIPQEVPIEVPKTPEEAAATPEAAPEPPLCTIIRNIYDLCRPRTR